MLDLFYEKMYRIRNFEENILELFSSNKLSGTTHTYIGQEAIAVAAFNNIKQSDYVFSNHRCHGHFIAYADRIDLLLAEIMGKQEGVCQGKGGSQHLCYKNFHTNGIQGGIVPNAVGQAFAEKIKKTSNIGITFIGDGTLGQGVVYESFNMASIFHIPILFVIEDNAYAMSTKSSFGVAGKITDRTKAFGIDTYEINSNGVEELDAVFKSATNFVRNNQKPYCVVIHTYRLGPHSKSDDYRDKEEIELYRNYDPVKLVEKKIDSRRVKEIQKKIQKEFNEELEKCEKYEAITSVRSNIEQPINRKIDVEVLQESECKDKGSVLLNSGLEKILHEDKRAVILGEDICDPYGGAFKVTTGLSTKFPEQVINTPISEAGIIGLGIGMAMNNIMPVIEVMFGDFITLGFDQLLNHAAKYNEMYAGQVNIPVLIRLPSGGGRGYGPTHSQSLEKYLVGIPNIRVVAPSPLHNLQEFIYHVYREMQEPTIFVENKKMYSERMLTIKNNKVENFYVTSKKELYTTIKLTVDKDEKADVAIITYGRNVLLAMQAAEKLLFEEEVMVDIIVCTQLAPLKINELLNEVNGIQKVCTLEEGTDCLSWGSEVISQLSQHTEGKKYVKVSTDNTIIPANAEMEEKTLPNINTICSKIRSM